MARKASGADQVASARELLRTAKTADELRTAQAVLLPLERGLSLEMTTRIIGRSIGATCNLRTRYSKGAWWSCLPSGNRSLNDWASRLRYRRSIGCWRATAGASWRPTRRILRGILRHARTGKKTPGEPGSNRRQLEQRPAVTPDVSGRGAFWTHLGHTLLLVPPPVRRMVASIAWCYLMSIPTACKSS